MRRLSRVLKAATQKALNPASSTRTLGALISDAETKMEAHTKKAFTQFSLFTQRRSPLLRQLPSAASATQLSAPSIPVRAMAHMKRADIWMGNKIPYVISADISKNPDNAGVLAAINQAIADYHTKTNIRFYPHNNEKDFITFQFEPGLGRSNSEVGKDDPTTITLGPGANKRTVLHEMGHALGLYHEQQRRDRDDFVEVYRDRIPDDDWETNYKKASKSEALTFGDYDHSSIMHYPENQAQYSYYWSKGWTSMSFFEVSGKKYLFLLKEKEGTVHIHEVQTLTLTLGPRIEYNWASGWTNAKFFALGDKTYLFVLKEKDGAVKIYEMQADGKIGASVPIDQLEAGWTSAEFFTVAGKTYLFLLNAKNGKVRIHEMLAGVKLGAPTEYTWNPGWTSAKFFTVNAKTYLFLLKEKDGTVHIHEMLAEAKLGPRTDYDWKPGWTSAEFFIVDDKTYLFLLKEKGGTVHVHEMEAGGKVGKRTDTRDWSDGWTSVSFLGRAAGLTYLYILKRSAGVVAIHRIANNGEIQGIAKRAQSMISKNPPGKKLGPDELKPELSPGDIEAINSIVGGNVHIFKTDAQGKMDLRIDTRRWTGDWNSIEFYQVNGKTFLFLLKIDGTVHLHAIVDGKVDKRLETSDFGPGWTSAKFFTVGAQTYLFLLNVKNGKVRTHEIQADGTVGAQKELYDWKSGWTSVEFFLVGGKTYLFLLKEGDGEVHIHEMEAGGKVGARVFTDKWSDGWTTANFFTVAGKTFLFLLKKGNGSVHIHEMLPTADAKIKFGARIDYDWKPDWTTASFYYINGKTLLFLLKEKDGIVHIHEMRADGQVGDLIKTYDWPKGWKRGTFFYHPPAQPNLFLYNGSADPDARILRL